MTVPVPATREEAVRVPPTIAVKGDREAALYRALFRDGRSYYSSEATRPSWFRSGFRDGYAAGLRRAAEIAREVDRQTEIDLGAAYDGSAGEVLARILAECSEGSE